MQILVGFGFNSNEHLEGQLLLGEWLRQQNEAKYHFINVTLILQKIFLLGWSELHWNFSTLNKDFLIDHHCKKKSDTFDSVAFVRIVWRSRRVFGENNLNCAQLNEDISVKEFELMIYWLWKGVVRSKWKM